MEKWNRMLGLKSRREKIFDEFNAVKKAPIWGFFVLIAVYIVGIIFVNKTSASDGVFILSGQAISHRSITGAISSVCNLCLVMLVVLYKRPGFYVSILALLSAFPSLIIRIIHHNFTVLPGIFTNFLLLIVICVIFRYINKSDRFQQKMRDQALTDRLTGLPNRFAVSEMTEGLVQKKEPFAIAVMNLNYFKNINSAIGQQSGDEALIQVANRWQKLADEGATGTNDFLATLNGNEFSVIIRDYASEEQLRKSVESYADALKEKIVIDNCDFVLSVSIGYATFPEDSKDGETLFDYAYSAMIQAKKTDHSGCICRFDESMLDDTHAMEVESKIRRALEEDRFFFNLQPQFDMNHKLRGFEALARMKDENGKIVSPGEFSPVAEKAGLVDQIDHKVLISATAFIGGMVQKHHTDAVLSVNASVRHLLQTGFVDEVREALHSSGLPAEQLEIEITESVMIDSVEKAIDCIHQLAELGVRIAIDDFGTGYSSLSYLTSFPVDVLKVDQSFILKMHSGEASKQYVAAIIAIGHVMNFRVVAEGVEETDQLDDLREIGCDYIQGFLWGKPMPPEDAAKLIEQETSGSGGNNPQPEQQKENHS